MKLFGLIIGNWQKASQIGLHHILKKHRKMFYWRLVHATFNSLQGIFLRYLGEKFLYAALLVVMLKGKHIKP